MNTYTSTVANFTQPEDSTPKFTTSSTNPNMIFLNKSPSENDASFRSLAAKQAKGKIPIVLKIKLSKDLVKEIKCYLEDSPELLAQTFCRDNNIPVELTPTVKDMIQIQFNQAKQGKIKKNVRPKTPNERSNSSTPSRDEISQNKRATEKSPPSKRDDSYSKGEVSTRRDHGGLRLIAKMDVNIGAPQSKELLLYEGEDPTQVAYVFCAQNGLPNSLVEALIQKLRHSKELYERKKDKLSDCGSSNTARGQQAGSKNQIKEEKSNSEASSQVRKTNRTETPEKRNRSPIEAPRLENKETVKKYQEVEAPRRDNKETERKFRELNSSRDGYDLGSPAAVTAITSGKGVAYKSSGPEDETIEDTEAANKYERWQNLIRERKKILQIEPNTASPRLSNDKKSAKERSRSPKKEIHPEECYKLAMKSLAPGESSKNLLEKMGSRDHLESSHGRKLNKEEEEKLINRLYEDAQMRKLTRDELKLFELGIRPMKEPKDLTFRPGIWGRGNNSTDGLRGRSSEGNDHDRSYNTSRERRERELINREQHLKETFTFKPEISEASKRLVERRNRSNSPVYEKLYNDGMASKKNKEVLRQVLLEEACPFKPNLIATNTTYNPEPGFFKRLTQRELKKHHGNKKESEKSIDEDRDPVTGQKLFAPLIKKDKYYMKAKEKDEARKKEIMAMREANIREQERMKKTSRSLKSIFGKLDDDKDGYISADKIELSGLSVKILEALIKVLDAIEDSKLKLNYEGFLDLVEAKLTPEEKAVLESEGETYSKLELNVPEQNGKHLETSGKEIITPYRSKEKPKSPKSNKLKPKTEEGERVTPNNLTKHYQRLLGQKESDSIFE